MCEKLNQEKLNWKLKSLKKYTRRIQKKCKAFFNSLFSEFS